LVSNAGNQTILTWMTDLTLCEEENDD
jgi:hypothetical protein